MKKFLSLLGVLFCIYGSAQSTTLAYTASTAVISNPERGFYKYSATHSDSYNGLNQNTLTNYRLNNNITMIFRYFYLENFINTPISSSYLINMQDDFNKLRNAGLKCVLRFAYSDDESASPKDASKAQILAHIQQLAPLLQSNIDVIAAVQAGFIGVWGEWYYTSQSEFGGWGYNETDLTTANNNHRKDVLNALLAALPASRMVQIRYPSFKQKAYSSVPITSADAYSGSTLSRIAHHNDCFLASATDYGTYDNVNTELPFMEQDTKYVPVGGETCKVFTPRSSCSSALYEMNRLHWSFLNIDYHPDVLDGFESGGCFTDIQKKLGYRFELKNATFPNSVTAGTTLPITFKVVNQGFATPFNKRSVYLVLKNLTTNQVFPILMATDPRRWAGPNEITVTENLPLPANLTTGNYKLYLSLPDSEASIANKPEFAIRLANDNMWESATGYNNLNFTLNVTTALGVADNSKFDMTIYPNPSASQLNVQLENIDEYKIAFYNALGQTVKVPKMSVTENDNLSFNVSGLSDGLYFVEFTKGSVKDTRKVIIRH